MDGAAEAAMGVVWIIIVGFVAGIVARMPSNVATKPPAIPSTYAADRGGPLKRLRPT